ncbi:MAG: NUDIX domain-containing protein [Chlamydiales bacterium]
MKRQLTATTYILDKNRVLLIYHKKLKKWLPPGGHLESHELPSEGAIREAKEETGLDIELIPQENVWINMRPNGGSIERPYLCLLEHIPEIKGEAAHQHIDLIYVGKPVGGEVKHNKHETEDIRWFSLKMLSQLEKEVEIYEETYLILEHLLSNRHAPSDRECK